VARAFAGDLAAYAVFWAPIAVTGAVAIAVFVANTGSVDASIWVGVHSFTRWLLLVGGIMAARNYVPLFVAHGISRRQVLAGMWPVVAGLAVLLGLASGVAFAVEGLAFDALGWPHVLSDEGDRFVFDRPDDYLVIVPTMAIADLAYLVTGALIGATYTRTGGLFGTLLLPLSVLPVVVVELTAGGWLAGVHEGPAELPAALALALALAACVLGGLGASLALRDVQLDNDNVAWWR
jgi:hypothetical protein